MFEPLDFPSPYISQIFRVLLRKFSSAVAAFENTTINLFTLPLLNLITNGWGKHKTA